MNEVIAWAVFAGAWLLVAGPLYQGSVELNELEIDRDALQAAGSRVPQPQMPSAWWWLLPPVMYVLATRRNKAYQRAVLAEMTDIQREQLVSFQSKAAGWLTVAGGGTLLAAGETWEVTEHYRWPQWVFWLILLAMLALAILNTTFRRVGNPFFRRPAGPTPETISSSLPAPAFPVLAGQFGHGTTYVPRPGYGPPRNVG